MTQAQVNDSCLDDEEEAFYEEQQEQERDEMENGNVYGNDGQLSLATLLLLTGGGFGAFGRGGYGGGGFGPHAGIGYGGPSIADEVAVHNLKTPTTENVCEQFRDLERQVQASTERNADGVGRLVDINRDLQLQASAAQCELRAEVAKCCCETQKEIIESRFTTQLGFQGVEKAICDQTNTLSAQATANTQRIIDTANQQEKDRLNRELSDCKAANSNLQQTNQLAAIVGQSGRDVVNQVTGQCCCDPCSDNGHHRGGGRGVDIAAIAQLLANQGWTPPGQSKTK